MSPSAAARAEENALSGSLFEWQSPAAMLRTVEQLGDILGNHAMQRRGRAFREGFVAGRFARYRGSKLVRLLREDGRSATPDFEVTITDGTARYETTEIDVPGRRRQLEYREPLPTGVIPMIFTPLTAMLDNIRLIVGQKAAKAYDRCEGLVVHLNPPMFSFEPKMRTRQLLEATESAASSFREVWLVRDRGVLLWENGVAASNVPDDF